MATPTTSKDLPRYGACVYKLKGKLLVKQTVLRGVPPEYVIDEQRERHVDERDDSAVAEAIRDAVSAGQDRRPSATRSRAVFQNESDFLDSANEGVRLLHFLPPLRFDRFRAFPFRRCAAGVRLGFLFSAS